MDFRELFQGAPPYWQNLIVPIAGISAALMAVMVGRLVLARRRARVRPGGDAAVHDPFAQGSTTDRRASARRKGHPIDVLVGEPDAMREPARAWVMDRSVGGLCLMLHEEVAPGTVLSVKPRNGPAGTPWVQVEVRNCTRDRSGYETRCQFVRTPPWSVLLLFG